jgi:photosystem II stability/assembly factor-like uncharacterized protein
MEGIMKKIDKCFLKLFFACLITTALTNVLIAQTNWTVVNTKSICCDITALLVDGNQYFLGTDGGTYISNDTAKTFTQIPHATIPFNQTGHAFVKSGLNVIAGLSKGLFKSTDGGVTWASCAGTLSPTSAQTLILVGNDIYAGTESGVYKTSDWGSNWTALNTGLTAGTLHGMDIIGNKMIAASYDCKFFTSNDYGANWTQVTNVPVSNVTKLMKDAIMSGSNFIAGTSNEGIFVSTDNGVSWTNITAGLTGVVEIYRFMRVGNKVYACTDKGTKMSEDHGLTWTNLGGITKTMFSFAREGNYLYAGTTSYLYKMDLPGGGASIYNSNQNYKVNIYPNPAKDFTSIEGLPNNVDIVNITDLYGKTVWSENNVKSSSLEINTSSFSSGIYILSIISRGNRSDYRLVIR